jgi:hypothetical protein
MYAERLLQLGHLSRTENSAPSLPDGRLVEPGGHERLANPKAFSGNHCALEVLPPLGLTFDSIKASCQRFGLPALDVGASVSTVAAEGALRNVEIHSTELPPIRNRDRFIDSIRARLLAFGPAYAEGTELPLGFTSERFPPEVWESCIDEAIARVNGTLIECAASQILGPDYRRAPDRSYAVVFSHHGVPKYCATEIFLQDELPELLRVAADRVHLFPFRSAGPGDELLHIQGSENYQRIKEIARAAGFTFETHGAQHLMIDRSMSQPGPGFDITAVFVRR